MGQRLTSGVDSRNQHGVHYDLEGIWTMLVLSRADKYHQVLFVVEQIHTTSRTKSAAAMASLAAVLPTPIQKDGGENDKKSTLHLFH